MTTADIYVALEWLSWRLFAKNKKYSQDYLDKMASKKLQEISQSPHLSGSVRERAHKELLEAAIDPKQTRADRACNDLCKHILRHAEEADFQEILANSPKLIRDWRKLWDGFRANKIHRI